MNFVVELNSCCAALNCNMAYQSVTNRRAVEELLADHARVMQSQKERARGLMEKLKLVSQTVFNVESEPPAPPDTCCSSTPSSGQRPSINSHRRSQVPSARTIQPTIIELANEISEDSLSECDHDSADEEGAEEEPTLDRAQNQDEEQDLHLDDELASIAVQPTETMLLAQALLNQYKIQPSTARLLAPHATNKPTSQNQATTSCTGTRSKKKANRYERADSVPLQPMHKRTK